MLVTQIRPKYKQTKPESAFRQKFFVICEHRYFDIFILTCICLNALVMAVKYVGMSKEMETVNKTINLIFTAIFFIEMVIRLIAYGKAYFKDYWNIFDFVIIVCSVILIIIQALFQGRDNLTSFVMTARLMRISRLLRLFR